VLDSSAVCCRFCIGYRISSTIIRDNGKLETCIVSEVAQEYLRLGACGLFSSNSSAFLPTRATAAGFGAGVIPVVVSRIWVSMASRRGGFDSRRAGQLVPGSCCSDGSRSAFPHLLRGQAHPKRDFGASWSRLGTVPVIDRFIIT
jgi:hypothetical protein